MTLAKRLLGGALILVAALVAAIVLIAGGRLRAHLIEETTAGLEREARLVALQWNSTVDAEVLASQAGRALGHRVTLVSASGGVEGDSEFDRAGRLRLENHGSRPEILAASATGRGVARRVSASAHDEELYVAVRHTKGFVRVSLSTQRLEAIVGRAQRDVLVSGLVALAGALALTALFARSVSQPIVELRNVARAIAAGDLDRRPQLEAPGEIGDLALALRRMSMQLSARLHAMEADEQLMTAILEALEEGVVALDGSGQVVRINAAARQLLNTGMPTPFSAQLLPQGPELRVVVDRALHGQSSEPVELVLGERTVAVASRPLATGGGVLAVADLTRTRQLEAVRRDFVANVSHELKTPLTAVSGYAETLMDDDVAEVDRRRFVETIRTNANRMQRIVDDLLDLSRIESGSWRPNVQVVDVRGIIADVITACASEAAAKGIALVVKAPSEAPRVRADPTALRQVLSNLVENAVRYTLAGAVTITVHPRGEWTSIRVADTGVGIASEHLGRVFERFYRVDAGRSRDAGGTGLGLSIVKHLVEAHGGEVAAESSPGRGTTIDVSFRAAP
ncbi:MAG: HAMP domain-containing protein [Gemmatimonadaceae bacterium]|nr:HAMP domain-containing protein [Gemmatimonadaceae bacterium]